MAIGNQYSVFRREQLRDFLQSILRRRQDLQWTSSLVLCISIGFAIYTKYDGLKSSPTPVEIIVLTVLSIGFVAAIGLLTYSLYKYWDCRRYTPEYIFEQLACHEVEHDTTAVLVIKKVFANIPKILVKRDSNWGYMLPYKKISSRLDNQHALTEVRDYLSSVFGKINADAVYLDEFTLENVIKINPKKNSIMKFTFGFYLVTKANYGVLARVVKGEDFKNYEWKSISEIIADPMTMKFNSDVVNRLNEDSVIAVIPESFSPRAGIWQNFPEQLRVIWNITDKCGYNCAFCATDRKNNGREKNIPNFESRIKIAEQLLNIPGVKIDIAGGDPLRDIGAREVIFHILKYMSRDDITITSTGKAFSSLPHEVQEELYSLCNHFDVSYDFPSGWVASHRGPEYNSLNFQQLKEFHKRNIDATTLITLSKENTQNLLTTNAMLDELAEIAPRNITLLRLMPVGKQNYESYPKSISEYNPTPILQQYQQRFGSSVKLHCAFRANNKDGSCNMLTEKIGVDHEGNIFACAWAGYLEVAQFKDNPFFLGNLLNDGGIEAIFKSERYSKLQQSLLKGKNNGCRIFSYLENRDRGLSENFDPLSASHG